MPIYEYNCKKCDTKFEKLVKSMNATEAVECPECGSKQTSRELSVFAAVSGSAQSGKSSAMPKGMCGRCGGPGPCGIQE